MPMKEAPPRFKSADGPVQIITICMPNESSHS
jgi:hypothetical protein